MIGGKITKPLVFRGVTQEKKKVNKKIKDPHKKLLKNARVNILGFTQKEMGHWLGVTTNTVARWERGELKIPQIAVNFLLYFYRMELFNDA